MTGILFEIKIAMTWKQSLSRSAHQFVLIIRQRNPASLPWSLEMCHCFKTNKLSPVPPPVLSHISWFDQIWALLELNGMLPEVPVRITRKLYYA